MRKRLWAWILAGAFCLTSVAPVYAEEVDVTASTSSNVESIENSEQIVGDDIENADADESAVESVQNDSAIEDGTEEIETAAIAGTCGDDLNWSYDNETLTISGTGAMNNYSNFSAPWYKYASNVKEIIIEDGATGIGKYAFQDFSSLTNINMPESLTSIEECAFLDCHDLTNIEIPSKVTNIGDGAFWECDSLKSIDIPSGVSKIPVNAFMDCSGLTSVNLSSGLERIEDCAFSGCCNLTKIDIPSTVTHMGMLVFNSCSSLKSIKFRGDAPHISFTYDISPMNYDTPTKVYYPANNSTWISKYIDDTVDGTLKWISYGEEKTSLNGIDYSAVYDYEYFHDNSDVAAAFGDDDEATLVNFVQWGMTTGRQGNEEFNVYIYMANYPELKATYGSNLASYYYHYIWWGKAAGLVANESLPHDPVTIQDGTDYSAVYDYEYFHANEDVAAAFGDDDVATLSNFVRWGMTTGRQGNAKFNVYIYRANYPKLREVYGNNLAGYYYHYIWWGKDAGLIANRRLPSATAVTVQNGIDYSAVYNYNYYHTNSDVAAAFGEDDVATLANFVRWGMTTGRVGSADFNVYAYMYNYPQLKEIYGDNLAGYYYHYIWWGKKAGWLANRKRSWNYD